MQCVNCAYYRGDFIIHVYYANHVSEFMQSNHNLSQYDIQRKFTL